MKALVVILLSLCFCLPGWAGQSVASLDREVIQEQVRKAARDLQIQLPKLLKSVRVRVQVPEIQVQVPAMRIQLPEILIPGIHLEVPVRIQIPEIQLPEIRIEIPAIHIQTIGFQE